MAMFGRATRNDTLKPYTPTMAERIPIALQGMFGRLGLDKYKARSFAKPIADALEWSPVGAIAQAIDAGQTAARQPTMFGKAGALGGGMALAALGAVPGGKALRKGEALAMDEASRMARATADELPMDSMRRLKRARQMGFDTADNNLVHYTAKDFDGFSLNGDPSSHSGGGAVWLTNDPSLNMAAHQTKQSGELVEGSRGIPVYINKGKPLPIGTAMEMKRAGQLNENFPQRVSAEEGDLLRGLGYSHFERGPETVVFDPANIRSKFAAFDPAKRGSANLLAGIGAGAIVAPSMFNRSRDQ